MQLMLVSAFILYKYFYIKNTFNIFILFMLIIASGKVL